MSSDRAYRNDHLVAGQATRIPVPNGLAANPAPRQSAVPATQPEADDAARAGVGRSVRYTALPDDSVSKLALILLGSDTPANRQLIIKSNPELKQDPDHVVAGQTYWIGSPSATSTR